MRVVPHGTYSGYNNHRCRCQACRVAAAEYRERAAINADAKHARLALWKTVYEAGRALRVCDDIVRNRPVPARLLAAVLAADDAIEEAASDA